MKQIITKINVDIHHQDSELFSHTDSQTPEEFLNGINEIEESNDDELTEDLDNDIDFIVDLCTHPEGGSLNWAYDSAALYVHKVTIYFEDGSNKIIYDFIDMK